MTLFVDDDRASVKLVTPLRTLITPTSLVQPTSLNAGDVYFTGNGPDPRRPVDISIEYKHVGDILQCIQDGRFAGSQLLKMAEDYPNGYLYLLVEEEIRADPRSGVLLKKLTRREKSKKTGKLARRPTTKWVPVLSGPGKYYLYKDLMHWLMTMQMIGGVHVVNTYDIETSAMYIASLYWWWNNKTWKEHRSLKVFHERQQQVAFSHRKPTTTEKVANAFTGVGYDRARNIGRQFSSPFEFINAPLERLQSIKSTRDPITKRANNDGLGKELGRSLYSQIHNSSNDEKNRR